MISCRPHWFADNYVHHSVSTDHGHEVLIFLESKKKDQGDLWKICGTETVRNTCTAYTR